MSRSLIGTILAAQTVVTCLAAVGLLERGSGVALSALMGGLICIVPNLYLAWKLTARQSVDPNKLGANLFAAELGKILITATLFALVFATQEWIQPVALLGGFGLAQLTHWVTPLWPFQK